MVETCCHYLAQPSPMEVSRNTLMLIRSLTKVFVKCYIRKFTPAGDRLLNFGVGEKFQPQLLQKARTRKSERWDEAKIP